MKARDAGSDGISANIFASLSVAMQLPLLLLLMPRASSSPAATTTALHENVHGVDVFSSTLRSVRSNIVVPLLICVPYPRSDQGWLAFGESRVADSDDSSAKAFAFTATYYVNYLTKLAV